MLNRYDSEPAVEWIFSMDSWNTLPNPDQKEPDSNSTNDIIVPVCLSANRVAFNSLEAATFEIPTAQYLIENNWNRVYYSNGIFFRAEDEGLRTVYIETDTALITAVLPLRLNEIVAIDATDPANPIFTTSQPHLLESLQGLWAWGERVRVISTALEFSVYNSKGNLLPTVNIIDDVSFSVSGFPGTTNWIQNAGATSFGYLLFPTIPGPTQMANILEVLLARSVQENVLSGCAYTVTYNSQKAQYCISQNPQVDWTDNSTVCVTQGSVLNLLGFGIGQNRLHKMVPDPCAGRECTDLIRESVPLCSKPIDVLGTCMVQLTPGNYPTSAQLTAEIAAQVNRFYLPVEENLILVNPLTGESFEALLPPGLYTPESMAQSLEFIFATLWADLDLEVTYFQEEQPCCEDENPNYFQICSGSDTKFNMDMENSSLAYRLGFTPTSFTCHDCYVSNLPFIYSECMYEGMYFPCIWDLLVGSGDNLVVTFSQPPPLALTDTTATVSGSTVTVTNLTQAHGLQVGQLVSVTVGTDTYTLVVSEVVSGTTFRADLGALDLGGIAPNTPVGAVATECCTPSLLFAPRKRNYIMGAIWGFGARDHLWAPDFQGTYTAPGAITLTPRHYVLVAIKSPIGSARFEHCDVNGSTPTNLIAKVNLDFSFNLNFQRFYNARMNFFSPTMVTQLHIQLLNADGSLYQLHNRHWSATFRLYTQ